MNDTVTVDGRNPANQLIRKISHYLQGFYTFQVVQDFLHQQHGCLHENCHENLHSISLNQKELKSYLEQEEIPFENPSFSGSMFNFGGVGEIEFDV